MHDDDAVGLLDLALVQGRQIVGRHIADQLGRGNHRVEALRVQIVERHRMAVLLQRLHHGLGDGRVEAAVVGMPQDDRNVHAVLR